MGRELLSLNLSFPRVAAGPPEAMPGEARQAFKAIAALPPLRYLAPDPSSDPASVPRGDLPHADLVRQPLLHKIAPKFSPPPPVRPRTPGGLRPWDTYTGPLPAFA